jgi:hypothetical protein
VDGVLFTDDVGMKMDITVDPPQVFANAALRSVARLNLDAVLKHLPAAKPSGDDIPKHSAFSVANERDGGRRSVLVSLVPFLRPLYRGSKNISKRMPQWTTKCKGYLNSAINGGQWTQTMKARLPTFEGTTKCQLCHLHEGTLLHRHCCAVTTPSMGWTPFDEPSQAFLATLSEDRANAVKTRAVLTVSIPIAEPQVQTNGWQWVSDPPDVNADDLTWVIDGSKYNGATHATAPTGCGVTLMDAECNWLAAAA